MNLPIHCLKITAEELFAETLSPLIYGDFVEFINDLVPGMWAEKVRDRCFEGLLQPRMLWQEDENWAYPRWRTFVAGQPRFGPWPDSSPDLDMVQVPVRLMLDQYQPFVGRQSARVSVSVDGLRLEAGAGKPFVAGITQDNIAVKRGQRLRIEMYARGQGLAKRPGEAEAVSLQVLLGKNYGVFFKVYTTCEFLGVGDEWKKYAGVLTPDVSDDQASLAIGISRPGVFWLDKVSLMPEDHLCGWRPDVVAAVRAMKPGIIRFGGSSLIYYQWQNGIGPRDRRAPFENRPWGNLEENDVGLHEFLQFCELVGAEPLICVNTNSTAVEQILDEIEYCNGPAESGYGRIRAEMGHPQPFDVKYWQLGNEQSGEEYEAIMVRYARAIRGRYPGLVLLASYPSDRILADLSGEVDYVCPHLYAPYTKAMEDGVRELIARIRQHARNKDLKLGITEWNHTAGHWGWSRAWLLTLYNALNAARMWNMYQRLGDMVRIANRSNMTNSSCSGVIQTSASDIYFTPCYYVQKAYANLAGDKALKVLTRDDEALDVSATRRGSNGEVALFVVNYLGEAQVRHLDLADLKLSRSQVGAWTLMGLSLDAVNSFEDKGRVAPVETVIGRGEGRLQYEFPAYSVTVLRFK